METNTKQEEEATLSKTLGLIAEDPSIPEEKKVHLIVHLTALACALVAVQPIPFADIFVLTPIQLVMVTMMNRVMGRPAGEDKIKEIVASLLAVVGWGILAQQTILGLYKTVLPFMGGLTTIPLVYAATVGLGYAAKAFLEAKRQDRTVPKDDLKRIASEAREKARRENKGRSWTPRALKKELSEWKDRAEAYGTFKNENRQIALLRDELLREQERLTAELALAIPGSEVDELIQENKQLSAGAQELRARLAKLEQKLATVNSRGKREVQKRFRRCYPELGFSDGSLEMAARLSPDLLIGLERLLGLLNHRPDKVCFRCRIHSTYVDEIGFAGKHRLYVVRQGGRFTVVRIGSKATQKRDIESLRLRYLR